MKYSKLFLHSILIFLVSKCAPFDYCPPEINLVPMYGKGKLTKCSGQIEADKIFLSQCDSTFPNRKLACAHYVKIAWYFFYRNVFDTAMFRFNQAWLCDTSNPEIYWGYGNIMGKQQKYIESLGFFYKAISLNPSISNLWYCTGLSYGQLFFQTKGVKLLDSAIVCFKQAVRIDPKNANAYGQLAANYTYLVQKDSAKRYLKIADSLDSTVVNPEVRKVLTQ